MKNKTDLDLEQLLQHGTVHAHPDNSFRLSAVATVIGALFALAVVTTVAKSCGPAPLHSVRAFALPSPPVIFDYQLASAGDFDIPTGLPLPDLEWRPTVFSVYAVAFDGRTTASGLPYLHTSQSEPLGCASNDLPLGSWIVARRHLATYDSPEGRKRFYATVVLRVNDRLHDRFTGKRTDLSGGAYHRLDLWYDFTDETASILKGEYAVISEDSALAIADNHRRHD